MAIDIFLRIDPVQGESQDARYRNQIPVLSYSYGVQAVVATSTGGGAAAGRATATELSMVLPLSTASMPLLRGLVRGTHFTQAVLTLVRTGPNPIEVLTVTMDDVLVTTLHQTASLGEDRIYESLSLAYASAKWSYTPQLPDGRAGSRVETQWDFVSNAET